MKIFRAMLMRRVYFLRNNRLSLNSKLYHNARGISNENKMKLSGVLGDLRNGGKKSENKIKQRNF